MVTNRDNTPAPAVNPRSVASHFDAVSSKRNEIFRANPVLEYEQQSRASAVLECLNPKSGEVILDIGCGNARDIIPVLQTGATVVGIDLSEGMIRQAKQDLHAQGYDQVAMEVGDATAMRFASASFDKVLCSEVIEHIPDAGAAIAEMCRVLKPGGQLVISTPNRSSWYGFDRYVLWPAVIRKPWNHPYDNWRNTDELRALLEQNGLRVSETRTTCFVPGFLLTYRLPFRTMQRGMVRLVAACHPFASRMFPRNGYLIVMSGRKHVA